MQETIYINMANLDDIEKVRILLREEGKSARNILAFSVPCEVGMAGDSGTFNAGFNLHSSLYLTLYTYSPKDICQKACCNYETTAYPPGGQSTQTSHSSEVVSFSDSFRLSWSWQEIR